MSMVPDAVSCSDDRSLARLPSNIWPVSVECLPSLRAPVCSSSAHRREAWQPCDTMHPYFLKSNYEVRNKLKFLIFWSSKISILIDTALEQVLRECQIPSVKGQRVSVLGFLGHIWSLLQLLSFTTEGKGSHRQYINEWAMFNITFICGPWNFWISQTFHVSWNLLLIFVQLFKKVTAIFSPQAIQN